MENKKPTIKIHLNFFKSYLVSLAIFFPAFYFFIKIIDNYDFWNANYSLLSFVFYPFLAALITFGIIWFNPISVSEKGIRLQSNIETYSKRFLLWGDVRYVVKKRWLFIIPYISFRDEQGEIGATSLLFWYNDIDKFKNIVSRFAEEGHPLAIYLQKNNRE